MTDRLINFVKCNRAFENGKTLMCMAPPPPKLFAVFQLLSGAITERLK